jgi:uncharacterized protein (TIGR00162 family)
MVCTISLQEKPRLRDPVLVEGLPGIGFVANIAALHLIRELNATLFATIHCSSFQDFAVTTEQGGTRSPTNELYYHQGTGQDRDLIILHGNTQALTTRGQYELCGRVLDICEQLGSHYVITLGGLKVEREVEQPKLYFAATDEETGRMLRDMDVAIIRGQIFGVAGLLVGIGRLRGFQGFCLLAETLGLYPDKTAAREVLKIVGKVLNLNISLDRLDETADATRNVLENFGLLEHTPEETKKESGFRWVV